MSKIARQKQERVVEAVRRQLQGEAALEFIRQSGFALSGPGFARHLRTLGGIGHLMELIAAGHSNAEILNLCGVPSDDTVGQAPPDQSELFPMQEFPTVARGIFPPSGGFETTKISLRIPTDLYEAIGLAARGEGATRAQLIVDILTHALSRMPSWDKLEAGEEPE